MKKLRIIFCGTPDFAEKHLQTIINSNYDVVAVYTQPDRPSGRGRKTKFGPVKELALQHDIPIYQPLLLKNEEQQQIAALNADLMVVVAYGLILPQIILSSPKLGCINVHGSILPRWRGAAPIQRALAAGDKESGVTIMQMDAGLDTGDMLIKANCPIYDNDTSASLHDRLIKIGQCALTNALTAITNNTTKPEKQNNSLACYAHKLDKKEAKLDWKKTAIELERLVRALNPWPKATITIDNQTIKIWQSMVANYSSDKAPGTLLKADKEGIDIACGNGVLRVTHAQPASTRAMSVKELLNSRKDLFTAGKQLS